MLVVEGPDGAGKSTLVKHLTVQYPLAEGIRETTDRDMIYKTTRNDSFGAIRLAFLHYNTPQIWDRLGFWSDPIYAKYGVPSRKVAFTQRELHAVDQLFWNMRWPLIICLPPFVDVMANCNESHQMHGVNEHILDIYSSYRSLSMMWKGAIIYDYKAPDALELVKFEVEKYLSEQEHQYRVIGH